MKHGRATLNASFSFDILRIRDYKLLLISTLISDMCTKLDSQQVNGRDRCGKSSCYAHRDNSRNEDAEVTVVNMVSGEWVAAISSAKFSSYQEEKKYLQSIV